MTDHHLGYGDRLIIAALGSSVVFVSILIVICLVNKECWGYKSFFTDDDKKRKKVFTEKDRILSPEDPKQVVVKHPSITLSTTPEFQPLQFKKSSSESVLFYGGPDTSSILKSLTSKRDSTYSSMSENSGRSSPTNSYRSSAGSLGSAAGSNVGSPTGGEAQGHLSFAIQFVLVNKERATGKLIIDVKEARGLPGRSYMGGACDPYVKVVVNREKRSIRKLHVLPLQVFRTRTVRHTTEPKFDQSFAMDISRLDLKDISVKLIIMDSDKWVSSTTIGEVVQHCRDIKTLASEPDKIPLSFFISPSKVDYGEIFFSLSYLPTAQRLSVSVMKANRLKYTNVVDDISEFYPFVRALLINSSGKVLRKKKTTARANTEKPAWNETLIFDLAQHKMDQITFILTVCSRPQNGGDSNASESEASMASSISLNSSSCRVSPLHDKKQDKYLGKVVLGSNVPDEFQKSHWESIIASPRKAISQWHTLK